METAVRSRGHENRSKTVNALGVHSIVRVLGEEFKVGREKSNSRDPTQPTKSPTRANTTHILQLGHVTRPDPLQIQVYSTRACMTKTNLGCYCEALVIPSDTHGSNTRSSISQWKHIRIAPYVANKAQSVCKLSTTADKNSRSRLLDHLSQTDSSGYKSFIHGEAGKLADSLHWPVINSWIKWFNGLMISLFI